MTVSAPPTRVAQFDFKDSSGRPATVFINGEPVQSYTRDVDVGMGDGEISSHFTLMCAHSGRLCNSIKRTKTTADRVTYDVTVEHDVARST